MTEGWLRCDCKHDEFRVQYDTFQSWRIMRLVCVNCGNYRVERLHREGE